METTVEYTTGTGVGKTQTAIAQASLAHGDITELLAVCGRVLEVLEDDGIPCPLRYRARQRAVELRHVLRRMRPGRNGNEGAVTPATATKECTTQ